MRLQLIAPLAAIGASVAPPVVAGAELPLSADTLVYADDDRVTVVTSQAAARVTWPDGGFIGARAVVDVVSAASVDVVSQATPGFEETRIEGSLEGAHRFGRLLPSLSLRASSEPDYLSLGGAASATLRLAGGDATLAAELAVTLDTVGRAGTSFDAWSRSLATYAAELGWTQVVDRRTIVRAVYTLVVQDGYLEKPYRFVPLFSAEGVAAARDDGVALDLSTFDDYRLPERPPEEVPDRRWRHALLVRAIRHVDALDGPVRLDYRAYVDSWGLVAHTVEAAAQLALSPCLSLELRDRLHVQDAVAFWSREYVVEPGSIPMLRTIDRELSPYVSTHASLGLSWRHEHVTVYADVGVLYTHFLDFLFLDDRAAFIGQAGVRVVP